MAVTASAWHLDPATGQAVPGRSACRCGRELAEGGRCPRCTMTPDACMCPSLSEISAKMRPGGIVLDEPAIPAALWGKGSQVLASFGESTLIVGDDGTGKTTLAQALIRAKIGIGPPEVLGFPVAVLPPGRRALYLAMDRPRQAKRAMARAVSLADRKVLDERLVLWEGPPVSDLARDPSMLADMCKMAGASVCFADSLKDAALGLSEDAVGSAWNRARQMAIAAGTQMFELHHPRKATGDNPRPKSLQDVYGSRWITAGAGSVLFLWGKAGDPVIELIHLKQPADEVAGIKMVIDAASGTVSAEGGDIITALAAQGITVITAHLAAQLLYGTTTPDRNQAEKARRALKRLEAEGALVPEEPGGRGRGNAAAWRAVKPPPAGSAGGGGVDWLWSVLWDHADHKARLDEDS